MIKIGLIGFGYWGPNLARNFSQNAEMELAAVCDLSGARLEKARRMYPRALMTAASRTSSRPTSTRSPSPPRLQPTSIWPNGHSRPGGTCGLKSR